MAIELEELKSQIVDRVMSYAAQHAAPALLDDVPTNLGRIGPPSAREYDVGELVCFDDGDFVLTCFWALYERPPKPDECSDALRSLREGVVSKAQFIANMLRNPEGQRVGKSVQGLAKYAAVSLVGGQPGFNWLLPKLGVGSRTIQKHNADPPRQALPRVWRAIERIERQLEGFDRHRLGELESSVRSLRQEVTQHQQEFERHATGLQEQVEQLTKDVTTLLQDKANQQSEAAAQLEQITALQRQIEQRMYRLDNRVSDLEHGVQPEPSSSDADAPAKPQSRAGSDAFYMDFQDRYVSAAAVTENATKYAKRVASALPSMDASKDSTFLDIGCGRGEFLSELKRSNVPARGIDPNTSAVSLCKENGLDVEFAEGLTYVNNIPDGSLLGASLIQVIEHLSFDDARNLVESLYQKICKGGLLIIETVNPYSLVTLSRFWLDWTHTIPYVPDLTRFLVEHSGFTGVELEMLNSLGEHSGHGHHRFDGAPIADVLYGHSDYVVIGHK